MTGASTPLDPTVELLPDVPIACAEEDLLARGPVAQRLVELACAQPLAAPRVVALVGGAGTGKTSVVHLATAMLAERGDVAFVKLDAAAYGRAEPLLVALLAHLTELFSAAGVVDASDAVRDTLAGYGDIVSSVARIAGVKVDVAGALRRSPDSVRGEIAEMTQEVGKRIVLVIDHVDRLAGDELAATLEALRHWAAIPYVTIVLALDRHTLGARLRESGDDPTVAERLVQVELALPPPDRVLLARVLAGGLARVGARLGREIDDALTLFDPDTGLALELVATPRDAKRAVNAIAAVLPLWPPGADLNDACLEVLLRLLVPELDGPRLDARHRLAARSGGRRDLLTELAASLDGHPRAPGARAVLRALIGER